MMPSSPGLQVGLDARGNARVMGRDDLGAVFVIDLKEGALCNVSVKLRRQRGIYKAPPTL
jgi:hypothetical protein